MQILRTFALVLTATILAAPSVAIAGEVTGKGAPLPLMGRSLCKYSGTNDTPDGLMVPDGQGGYIVVDPGGKVQSYGFFKSQMGFLPSPSDPDVRAGFAFPGSGCNPNYDGGGAG